MNKIDQLLDNLEGTLYLLEEKIKKKETGNVKLFTEVEQIKDTLKWIIKDVKEIKKELSNIKLEKRESEVEEMSDIVRRDDCLKVIDRFIGYLDEEMIYRIKFKLKQDVPTIEGRPKGKWLRISNLSEQEDDRYKCSHCGNVVHYKNKMDLYTFNGWCGRCGSDNGRKMEKEKPESEVE